MKKLTLFILMLLPLIASEYFLISELFSGNIRIGIVSLCLAGTVIFVYAIVKFFKKYILTAKQS